MRRRVPVVLALVALAAALLQAPASGHAERESFFPDRPGRVPRYRTRGPALLVCHGRVTRRRIERLDGAIRARNMRLLAACRDHGYRNIQAAVDAVTRQGSRILVLPGVYSERPSARAAGGAACADVTGIISYEDHFRCPHAQNLIAILGDSPADADRECDLPVCRLQIEGTGARPEDVVIDNRFAKLNGIRADRADGVYFRNFTLQNSEFNSLYVIETDGYAIDRVVARWNDEYGFLTFSSDHGLYTHCEAYGNGDAGIYPGSAADLHGARPAVEIKWCNSHHNMDGLSGTSGNSLYVHDNRFHHNSLGASVDSLFPHHPGLPQDSATFVHNRFYSNNADYNRYWEDGTCQDREAARERYRAGVVCPTLPAPVGTGLLILGGNQNTVERNWFWNNWRTGTFQLWIPAALREEMDPSKQYDTSHFNRYVGNQVGRTPGGAARPNGLDFKWDVEGEGNCWEGNKPARGRSVTSDPPVLPDCDAPSVLLPPPLVSQYASCDTWDGATNPNPPGCDWPERPPRPSG